MLPKPPQVPWLDGKAMQGRGSQGSVNSANRVFRHDDRYNTDALRSARAQVSHLHTTIRQTMDKSFMEQLTKRQLPAISAVHPAQLHTWLLIHSSTFTAGTSGTKDSPPLARVPI